MGTPQLDTRLYSLDDLGITLSTDQRGSVQLSIEIGEPRNKVDAHRLFFNQSTRKWTTTTGILPGAALQTSLQPQTPQSSNEEQASEPVHPRDAQPLDSERQIRDLAVHSPAGIVRLDNSGRIIWANDRFYELTGHSRREEDQYEWSFLDFVDPIDHERAMSSWPDNSQTAVVAVRLKRKWQPPPSPDGVEQPAEPVWINSLSYRIVEDGEVRGVAAAVTDITHYKWAETTQARNAAAAKEAKRLQEDFIDIISHEMRNPLSAIFQLADGIESSMEAFEAGGDIATARATIAENVDNAKTILICASHQKRLIDDVLTLSKLDATMLSISPVVTQPEQIARSVLNMYEGELQSNDIACEAVLDASYSKHQIAWVCLDPVRLTQILINLLGNAIKFTKPERTRKIILRCGATPQRPPDIDGVQWFPTQKVRRDLTEGKEWGDGEPIFVIFEIIDTGRGMEQSEMVQLFGRFQQATAKTHIKYGGSGLGLFISRELAETHGGEIGVLSAPDKGSTFAFYIKTRRAAAPADATAHQRDLSSAKHDVTSGSLMRVKSGMLSNTGGGEQPSQKQSILLVEDNIVNAKILSRQLEKFGNFHVYHANHGQQALDFLAKSRDWEGNTSGNGSRFADVDFILMDMEMPIMDGLTCTKRIRQLEHDNTLTKHHKIIAITANARREQIESTMAAGVDDVMPKPFKVKELLAKLDDMKAKAGN